MKLLEEMPGAGEYSINVIHYLKPVINYSFIYLIPFTKP